MISIWRRCVGHAIEPRLQGSVSGENQPISAWGGGIKSPTPFVFKDCPLPRIFIPAKNEI